MYKYMEVRDLHHLCSSMTHSLTLLRQGLCMNLETNIFVRLTRTWDIRICLSLSFTSTLGVQIWTSKPVYLVDVGDINAALNDGPRHLSHWAISIVIVHLG